MYLRLFLIEITLRFQSLWSKVFYPFGAAMLGWDYNGFAAVKEEQVK